MTIDHSGAAQRQGESWRFKEGSERGGEGRNGLADARRAEQEPGGRVGLLNESREQFLCAVNPGEGCECGGLVLVNELHYSDSFGVR
jgi:hypothetical protein